jgi:hypothetical protein
MPVPTAEFIRSRVANIKNMGINPVEIARAYANLRELSRNLEEAKKFNAWYEENKKKHEQWRRNMEARKLEQRPTIVPASSPVRNRTGRIISNKEINEAVKRVNARRAREAREARARPGTSRARSNNSRASLGTSRARPGTSRARLPTLKKLLEYYENGNTKTSAKGKHMRHLLMLHPNKGGNRKKFDQMMSEWANLPNGNG